MAAFKPATVLKGTAAGLLNKARAAMLIPRHPESDVHKRGDEGGTKAAAQQEDELREVCQDDH